jgi:PST family polysaccharide transporter
MSSPRQAIVWSVVNALGTKGTNFVVYLVLARLLGPQVFGIVALGVALTAFLEVICEHKFATVLIQQEALSEAEKSSVFYFQIGAGVAAAVTVGAFAAPLGRLFGESQLTSVLPWLALAMLINTTTYVQEALLKRALKFKVLTIRSMAANLLGGAVGVALALAGFGVASMIAMLLASAAAGACVLWWTSGWRPSGRFSAAAFMPMYRSARFVASTAIAGAGALHANMFIVGFLFGASVAGLYSFALRIYDVLMRVTTFSLSDAAFPIFARKTGDLADYRASFIRLITSAGSMTVGLLMIVGALSPTLIHIAFGPRWDPASDYLIVYLLAGAFISVGAYNDITLLAFGRTKQVAAFYFAGLLIWAIQLPLLPRLGPLFPAIAWCVKEVLIFPWKARLALKLMGMPRKAYLHLLAPVVGGGVAAGSAVALVQFLAGLGTPQALLAGLTTGPIVFVLSIALLGRQTLPQMWARFVTLLSKR